MLLTMIQAEQKNESNETIERLPLLTLFTTWRDNADKHLNNTVLNWMSLSPTVIPVIFTNDTSVADECSKNGFEVMPISVSAADGIPVLKFMYRDVMRRYNSTFYAYSNSDILFTDTLTDTLLQIMFNTTIDLSKPTLVVGQRTNVDSVTLTEAGNWYNITVTAKTRGKLFTGWAEYYFITPRAYPWRDIAKVVIGRRAYDNWLVYYSRKLNYTVIDATKTILAVHQTTKAGNHEGHTHKNKDYNHNLLVKMYQRIKYGAGETRCIENYTHYVNGTFTVSRRNNTGCAV